MRYRHPNPELSCRPDVSGSSDALHDPKDEAEQQLARALAAEVGGRVSLRSSPAYSGYADWVRNSNSAARFREAFALADQMDPPLKMACVEKLYRIANAEWETVKDLSSASSQDRGQP